MNRYSYTNNAKLFLWYDASTVAYQYCWSKENMSSNDDATDYAQDQAVDSVIYFAALEATFN